MILLNLILFLFLTSCNQTIVENGQDDNSLKVQDLAIDCNYKNIQTGIRSPSNINEVTDLINALPKPLTLPCFIEALNRPLGINLTLSRLSAQPAVGNTSPRIFIFNQNLILSIAPEGKGANLLEMSELYSDSKSLKAELEFPILSSITYQQGYDRINLGNKSTCAGCHSNEEKDLSITEENAFTSIALKPESKMDLALFQKENYLCEMKNNITYRCQIIMALFKHDQIIETQFPDGTPKWIDTIN